MPDFRGSRRFAPHGLPFGGAGWCGGLRTARTWGNLGGIRRVLVGRGGCWARSRGADPPQGWLLPAVRILPLANGRTGHCASASGNDTMVIRPHCSASDGPLAAPAHTGGLFCFGAGWLGRFRGRGLVEVGARAVAGSGGMARKQVSVSTRARAYTPQTDQKCVVRVMGTDTPTDGWERG